MKPCLLKVFLSTFPQDDCVVWGGKRSGIYSVRSGYRLLLRPPISQSLDQKLFKQIWLLSCPPKIEIAMWIFLSSFLHTKLCLYSQRTANDPQCPRCNQAVEDVNHALRFCERHVGNFAICQPDKQQPNGFPWVAFMDVWKLLCLNEQKLQLHCGLSGMPRTS